MNLAGEPPLPAWDNLHAWYVADHATGIDSGGAVTRWAAVHEGRRARSDPPGFRPAVPQHGDHQFRPAAPSDAISMAPTTCGRMPPPSSAPSHGARSVAMLCRLNGTRRWIPLRRLHQHRPHPRPDPRRLMAGRCHARGCIVRLESCRTRHHHHRFRLAAPCLHLHPQRRTTPPPPSNTGSTACSPPRFRKTKSHALGGLIIGSNGGSPFTRLPVDIAEIAVYGKTLEPAEIAALDSAVVHHLGHAHRPAVFRTGHARPPRKSRASAAHAGAGNPDHRRCQRHASRSTGSRLDLRESRPGTVTTWRIHPGNSFQSLRPRRSRKPPAASATWSPTLNLPLAEGTNRIYLTAVPARHAPLGATIDAAVQTT